MEWWIIFVWSLGVALILGYYILKGLFGNLIDLTLKDPYAPDALNNLLRTRGKLKHARWFYFFPNHLLNAFTWCIAWSLALAIVLYALESIFDIFD